MESERQHLRHLLNLLLENLDAEDLGSGAAARDCLRASRGAVRLQAEPERDVLSVDAFGYLMTLVRTGQITSGQMETLIHFAQRLAESPLAPSDLDPLLEHVVFAGDGHRFVWRQSEEGARYH